MSTKNTKMNFPQIAEGWKARKRKYVKTSTYATYVTLADKHIIPFFQNKAHIDEQAVQQFIDQKLAEGLSIKTVKDILQILHGILHYGFRHCGLPQFDYNVHWPATAQQRTLPVLSQKDQRRLTAYLMQQHALGSPSSVQKAIASLLDQQLITYRMAGDKKVYFVADKYLDYWLRETY